jgi:hypothetical protein
LKLLHNQKIFLTKVFSIIEQQKNQEKIMANFIFVDFRNNKILFPKIGNYIEHNSST